MIRPIAISIGPIDIYWYGIVYALGLIFTLWFMRNQHKRINLDKNEIEDILIYTMILGVIGGRLFHIIFYDPAYYLQNPSEIIRFDKGGMSIHGGFIFSILSLLYFSKKKKFKLLKFTDLLLIPISLVLAIGRIANFINQELYGKITTSKLGINFYLVDENKRYPSQIFESVKNYIIFVILTYTYYTKKLKDGVITSWFLILYNGLRIITGIFREPELELFAGFGMGQLLSLIGMIIGIILLISINKKRKIKRKNKN